MIGIKHDFKSIEDFIFLQLFVTLTCNNFATFNNFHTYCNFLELYRNLEIGPNQSYFNLHRLTVIPTCTLPCWRATCASCLSRCWAGRSLTFTTCGLKSHYYAITHEWAALNAFWKKNSRHVSFTTFSTLSRWDPTINLGQVEPVFKARWKTFWTVF